MVLSQFTLNCTVDRGAGEKLDVVVYRGAGVRGQSSGLSEKDEGKSEGEGGEGEGGEGREVEMVLEGVVSFKEAINFREKFSKFSELGVGGLKREIDELYRRAFASRGRY